MSRSTRALRFQVPCHAAIVLAAWLCCNGAQAGPPFTTDDPEPIDHRHWELYLGSQSYHDDDGWVGTAPLFEVNYGVVPDVQLHLIVPLAFAAPAGEGTHYGPGDVETGAKLRFVHESDRMPQIGTYPMLDLPIGRSSRGLGNGAVQIFVPLWIQKSFGPWTTYGGPGYWINRAANAKNWWYFGWEIQRRIFGPLTVGVEFFHETPQVSAGDSDTRFNVGIIWDISPTHHILASAGRSIVGSILFQSYAAWLVTLGPSGPR